MTLVVARHKGSRIAITSDTQVSAHNSPLPLSSGILKSCLLPNSICVSFAGSPELATEDIWKYSLRCPVEAEYEDTVSFFEFSSRRTDNEYIIAFSKHPKLVKIARGRRQETLSSTVWIGDKSGFELFRELEAGAKQKPQAGRAVSAVLMAGDGENSLASDLYSTMRNVLIDQRSVNLGGFPVVVSNNASGFHFPCLSDILYNWPSGINDDFELSYEDKLNLGSSGENEEFSVSMFSSGYPNLSIVGFYLLRGRVAYLFAPERTMVGDRCVVIKDCDPLDLSKRATEVFGIDMGWQIWIAGPSRSQRSTFFRDTSMSDDGGLQAGILMHCNSFADNKNSIPLPQLQMHFPGPN